MAGSFAVSSLVVAVYRSSGPLAAGTEEWGRAALLLTALQCVLGRGDATPACMPVEFVAQWLPRLRTGGRHLVQRTFVQQIRLGTSGWRGETSVDR